MLTKSSLRIVIILFLLAGLFACEADLQVYTDDFMPTPVVYCLINPVDSVHYIRLSKSIDASVSPASQKDSKDALVFPEAAMEVKLVGNFGDTLIVYPELVNNFVKDSGFFGNSTHSLYSFNQVMDRKGISLYKEIFMEINIPGMPVVKGSSDILVKPRIRQPMVNAQYVFIDDIRPLLVQWYGEAWNEVDVKFDIMEQYRDSIVTQSLTFQESTVIVERGICEIHIPYDLILHNMKRILKIDHNIVRRYMGPIAIQVHTGNEEFAYYMDTKNGINDFSGQFISNLENAIGFIGCKLSFKFDTLHFDHFTRKKFEMDPELAGLKFKEF